MHRPLLLSLASLLVLAAAPAPHLSAQTSPSVPKPSMGSTVFRWEDLPVKMTPNGERRDVANHATPTLEVFECHITTLNPGKASHEPHRHPQEELIVLKEGTVEVHINGRTQNAGPGSTFFYASNDAHRVLNVGADRATYWVINLATRATHAPAEQNQKPSLLSGIYDWTKLSVTTSKVGERRSVLNGSTVTLANLESHITTVNAGEAPHAAHRHPDEEIILIKEGTVEATINGVAQLGGPGSVFFFASNDLHGMRNVGTTRATYHVIRIVTAATPPALPAKK